MVTTNWWLSTVPSKTTKAHFDRVSSLGCVLCRLVWDLRTPAEIHHVFDSAARSDWLVVPLCPEHHRGKTGFHGLGQRAFERRYKTTEAHLLAETIRLLSTPS